MLNIINQQNNNVNSGRGYSSSEAPTAVGAKSRTHQRFSSRLVAVAPRSNNKILHYSPNYGLKIAFLGTPEFAVPILEKLAQSDYKPTAVFTAPDKPVGRQQILTPPPVKITAQKYNIPIHQPKNTSDFILQTPELKPDLIISAAYGLILPKEILELPKYGCLNIHPSLLPKYRGPSPIQYTILNGDKKTGVTIIKMTEKVDAGPVVAVKKLMIETTEGAAGPERRPARAPHRRGEQGWSGWSKVIGLPRLQTQRNLTTPELSEKLALIGADLLLETLPAWLAGKIQPQPQDELQATYAKIIKKQDGLIDWQKPAEQIERQIRAFTPWPGTYTKIKNQELRIKNLKIIKAEVFKKNAQRAVGEAFLTKNNELIIQAGENALLIKTLQLEGGKPISAKDFLHGHQELIGTILR